MMQRLCLRHRAASHVLAFGMLVDALVVAWEDWRQHLATSPGKKGHKLCISHKSVSFPRVHAVESNAGKKKRFHVDKNCALHRWRWFHNWLCGVLACVCVRAFMFHKMLTPEYQAFPFRNKRRILRYKSYTLYTWIIYTLYAHSLSFVYFHYTFYVSITWKTFGPSAPDPWDPWPSQPDLENDEKKSLTIHKPWCLMMPICFDPILILSFAKDSQENHFCRIQGTSQGAHHCSSLKILRAKELRESSCPSEPHIHESAHVSKHLSHLRLVFHSCNTLSRILPPPLASKLLVKPIDGTPRTLQLLFFAIERK